MSYTISNLNWLQITSCLEGKGVIDSGGFMYKEGNPEGLSKYHIHWFVKVIDDTETSVTGLLTKSGNWRGGNEPDLADMPMAQWLNACAGMDSSTIFVVQALMACFQSLGATYVP